MSDTLKSDESRALLEKWRNRAGNLPSRIMRYEFQQDLEVQVDGKWEIEATIMKPWWHDLPLEELRENCSAALRVPPELDR